MFAAQTLDNVRYTMQCTDSFISGDDDATPRMPSKPSFEPLRLPIFNRTLSTSSSSSGSVDSSSDESALPSPTGSYGRSFNYSSTHSQLKAAPASNPRRQMRPRIFARESSYNSTTSEAELAVFPHKQVSSRPKPENRRRAVNKFAVIGRPSAILTTLPITSMPSMSRSDSSSSSSSDQATPTEERPRMFRNSFYNSYSREQHTNLPAPRPLLIDVSSLLTFDIATPPAFTTPKSSPRIEGGEWSSGTAGLNVFQVLSRVNEKLDVEAMWRMKLDEAGKGMNREVWDRRMARRGGKAL